jgi:NADPH-dependent F420 reductase
MKVSIIGTGNMGSSLAAAFAAAGHEIVIGARDPAKAIGLAEKIGRGAIGGTVQAAAQSADVVVLAVPYPAMSDVIAEPDVLAGKVVVDVSNPITADFKGLVVGHATSAAEEIQKLAPQAHVVKAYNTIFAPLLDAEARQGKTPQVFVASDNESAKSVVAELVRSTGFEPVESGPLSNSRFIEPIGEMNIHFGFFLGRGLMVAPAWVQV